MLQITPDLAEICGIHAGDGYLRKRENRVELEIGGSIEEQEYYDNHVVPLFKDAFDVDLIAKKYVKGTYGFITSNQEIAKTLNDLGFPFGKKSDSVRVPKLILESGNLDIYSRFLRGFLDTDGHIGFKRKTGNYCTFKLKYNYYPTITLTTISKELSEDVHFLLNKLGINHFVHEHHPKNPRDNYVYLVIINGVERLEKWMEIIGTKNSVQHSRYLVWKRFGFCPTHTTLLQRKDILNGKLDIYSLGPWCNG